AARTSRDSFSLSKGSLMHMLSASKVKGVFYKEVFSFFDPPNLCKATPWFVCSGAPDEHNHSGSPREDKDQIRDSAPKIRDVFGDFDDDEEEDGYTVHHDIKLDSNRPPVEEKGYEKGLRPEDILADKDHRYGSEEENYEMKTKEKPLRPPLELEVPLQPPPALPEKMNMIKVSNIMGVDPKPFDRKTYVEEDTFVTDESGAKKCIHLESNIVRWRTVRNPDGTSSVSNCMQLLFCF
ncbi:hypothetical protein S245_026791, partial [Arachis hypogaea]